MNFITRLTTRLGFVLLCCLSMICASAQTITSGVQAYLGLTNATVTVSGRSIVVITGTNNPLSGSSINLTSSDSWIWLPNIRPAVVSSTYLSQVQVNGATAVAGSNCRVDEYAMGTMIVPQASSFTPLQIYSGPNFVGNSNSLGIYTYYTNTVLGKFQWNISSFKLKRGYSATFAQFADGTGASKVFVAQDGDLEIGLLPTNLDHQCSYVRVFPWRWTGKKGWGGGVETLVDELWSYDWNNGASSTLNTEYVPMKWGNTNTWNYYSAINSEQNSTHVLGFNEPDSSVQSGISVTNAVALWPQMMQSGLRLGAPAVSDSGVTGQGLDWLYSFMNIATNLGYRVDYVPIHFYKCAWTATQLSNYLAGVYQVTGRPIWVTEFNYGADWCTATDQATEATQIASYLSMLESMPFVERYAIYSWFGTNRTMIVNGVLTPAGTNYLKQQSGLAYVQEAPAGGSRGIAQYSFETNTLDSSGFANNAIAVGVPPYASGHSGQGLQLDGANSYLQLPKGMASKTTFTFAAWVYWNGGSTWQRIFDFGNGTSQYMFLTPSSGTATLRFAMTTNTYSSEQTLETTGLTSGRWYHVAVTCSGSTVKLYTNGVLANSSTSFTINPSLINPVKNYLGKSQFSSDPLYKGLLDEVIVSDTAYTAAQIASLQTNNAPQFTTNYIVGGTATIGTAYSGSVAGSATDVDSGDTLAYSKATGAAWLTVGSDGTLSGTPTSTDGGTNYFTLRVTDAAGASAYAVLQITTPFAKGNGIWYVDGSGNWSDTSKWARTCPADGTGVTADFSTLDITADRTVTLDSSRTLGSLRFADKLGSLYWMPSSAQFWTVAGNAGTTLTLDSGSATSPTISVGLYPTFATNETATISASLAGTNGFAKTGWGTLVLSGGNPLSGTLYVDTSSTYTNDGVVRLSGANVATNLTAISIRNNNTGSSTLQLTGGVMTPAAIALNGRSSLVPGIENISGSNYVSGGISINVGGGYYWLQSDAGTLSLGGIVSSAATGTRSYTFMGAGDSYVSGSIQNGSATTVNVMKQDAGTLTLANANTFTGVLSAGGGAVRLSHPLAVQNNVVVLPSAVTNALRFGPVTGASIGSLAGVGDFWLTNSSASALTLTNGGNNGSSEYAGAMRGSGGMFKTGTGTLTLDGTNAYSGATTIANGTVKFGSSTNYIATLQPVVWLSFDQVGSSIVTNQGSGGAGLNGTIVGSGAYVTTGGRFGNALYLDGSGTNTATNYVKITGKAVDTSVSGSWTLGCWIKTTTAGATFMYQGDGGWSSSGQTTYLLNGGSASTAGTKVGAVRWGGGFLTGTTALNDGSWHFLTIVDTSGTETLYVDGVADAVTSSMANALASGANQTWIGGAPDTDAGSVKMTGMIDEVVMFDRALTAAQIKAIYTNAPITGHLPSSSAVSLASAGTLDLAGTTQAVASLADYNGAGGVVTNSAASTPVTLILGVNNFLVSSFSGLIDDASAANAISVAKTGYSTEVLNGVNTYSGATSISNGTLIVNSSIPSTTVSVRGGTLAGNGTVQGPVTVYSGGTLSPGSNAVGVLTINNTLTLNGITYMELDKGNATNDQVQGLISVNYGGTLTVNNLSGTLVPGDSFRLFNAATWSGAFAYTNLPALGLGQSWVFDPATGTLSVIQAVAVNPTNLVWNVSGNALTLSWPSDHTGWRLLLQTNNLANGLSSDTNDWDWVPLSDTTNQVVLPIDTTQPAGFYKLTYP